MDQDLEIKKLTEMVYDLQVKQVASEIFAHECLARLFQTVNVGKVSFENYGLEKRKELLHDSHDKDVRFSEDILSEIEDKATKFNGLLKWLDKYQNS